MADALDAVALKFPDQTFAIIDVDHSALPHRPRNVHGITFNEEEAGFLAGRVAVLALDHGPGDRADQRRRRRARHGRSEVYRRLRGGSRAADPNVTTLRGYTNDSTTP